MNKKKRKVKMKNNQENKKLNKRDKLKLYKNKI